MKITATIYSVGDKVTVKPGKEHNAAMKGKTGTIQEICTPALGVKFEGMATIHKWYADDEVQPAIVKH